MKRKNLFIVILALILTLSVALVACDKTVSGDEVGVYYFDSENGEYTLTLNKETQFILEMGGETYSGKYALKEADLTLKFSDRGVDDAHATYRNEEITLAFNSVTMKFIRKINYTVSFVTNGGGAVDSRTVVNGRALNNVDAPTRNGYRFVGWYADEALTTPYDFSSAVTKDITLYAKWQQLSDGRQEYTVTFDGNYDGASVATVETVNSKILDMPSAPTRSGYTFVGWFVSMYDDGDKLCYEFTDTTTVTGDMVVYAAWSSSGAVDVGASVYEKQMTWNATSGVYSYTVTLKLDSEIVKSDSVLTTTYTGVDFSNMPAGNYVIEITGTGLAGITTRYYINKPLDKVTGLQVVDGTVLTFNPVANAERYLITIDCGNKNHNHAPYDNGNSTSYNFQNCPMQPSGITFVVTAVADGYVSSQSEMFVYVQNLDGATGIAYDAANATISWNSVDNATNYVVTLVNGADEVEIYNGNGTSVCVKQYDKGQYVVKVVATAWGYNQSETEYSFTKDTLATPSNVKIDDTTVSWDAVEGATSYKLLIGGEEFVANGTSYDIASIVNNWEQGDNYTLSVVAVGDKDSLPSDELDIKYLVISGTLLYNNGYVSWRAVADIDNYIVYLNGNEIAQVNDGNYNVAVSFDNVGANTITLAFTDDDGNNTQLATLEVYVYKIVFDVSGGEAIDDDTIYLAQGDEIAYPSETSIVRAGYDFVGWYTAPDGDNANRRHFTDRYFSGDSDIVLYASWELSGIHLAYNYGAYSDGSVTEEYAKVYYDANYTLVIPTTNDENVVFAGWYTAENGNGTRLTDEFGNSLSPWTGADSIDVYAYWAQILSYVQHEDGTYGVMRGAGINYVTSVKVPATHNGSKVSIVEGFAFSSCLRLQSISIPNTVTLIESTAFDGCVNLQTINMYNAGAVEVFYYDIDGVVFHVDEAGVHELANFPFGRTGSYTVPNGISQLPAQVFAGASITEIVLSDDVNYIGPSAFLNCTRLSNVVFGNNTTLQIDEHAFQNCVSLKSITIPNGVEFDLNVFDGCSSLNEIVASNGMYQSFGGMLASGTTLVYAPKGISGNVTIPAGISAIGSYAFQSCNKLTDIFIPSFVTSIDDYAFSGCAALVNVIIGTANADIVDISIGNYAFANNRSLKTVTLRNVNVVTFGEYAFSDCTLLETVTFDNSGETTVGAYAFYNDYSLVSVSLPANVSVISPYAFANCTSLTNVNLPSTLNEICEYAFSGCTELHTVEFASGNYNLVVNHHAFNNTSSLTSINLPEGLTFVGEYAFNASGLTQLILPNSLAEFERFAFTNCASLAYVKMPDGLETLGYHVFYGCTSLTRVNIGNSNYDYDFARDFEGTNISELEMGDGNNNYTSSNGLLYSGDGTVLVMYFGASEYVEIAATVTAIEMNVFKDTPAKYVSFAEGSVISRIGDFAFANAQNLETVALPDSVTEIAQYAFMSSGNLRVVSGGNIASIGQLAFYHASSLQEIDLSHLTYMSQRAFEGASTLASVTLSSQLTTIPNSAFSGCTSLASINLDNVTSIGERAFYNCALTNVTFNPSLTTIDNYAFSGCGMTSVTIPVNVTSLGMYAFEKCTNLVDIKLSGLTIVSTGAFSGCTSLTSVDLSNVTKIENSSFNGCSKLSNVDLSGVSSIGMSAFNGCSSLTSINLSSVTRIDWNAFYGCTSLQSVTFADVLDELTIGDRAFANCSSLTSIVFPSMSEEFTIESETFTNCSSLTSIVLPATLTKIYEEAFSGCTSLASIDFSACKSLTSIDESAFSGCTSLVNLDLDGCTYLTAIESNAFANCTKLETVLLPLRLASIGNGAFDGCTHLKEFEVNKKNRTFTVIDGVLFNVSGTLLIYPAGKTDEEYEMPSAINKTNVAEIASGAFVGNTYLLKVTISATVETIHSNAFVNCTSLQTIVFANECVAVCENDAFSGCSAISNVELGENASPDVGNLFNGTSIREVVVSKDTVTLPRNYFANMTALTTVTFEEGSQLMNIEYGAFAGCTALEEIDLTNCLFLTEIGNSAFADCTALQRIALPNSLKTIGNFTFEKCTSLSDIFIPASVTEIGPSAFNGCTSLVSIRISPNSATYASENGVLYSKDKTTLIRYLVGTPVETYVVPDSVAVIGSYAFQNNTTIQNVVLPYGLLEIQNSVFDSSSIESINIPASVVLIKMYAFRNCTKLTDLTFDKGGADILTIAQSSFINCTAIESITFPARLRTKSGEITGANNAAGIGNSAFEGCTALKTIDFEEDTNFITTDDMKYLTLGDYAFEDCSSLETVTLPSYVAAYVSYISANKKGYAIGYATFLNCTSLKTVNIVTTEAFALGDRAFAGCTAIKELTLPSSLYYVGPAAFYGWTAQQTIYMKGIMEAQSNSWGDKWSGPWNGGCNANIVWNA